MAIRSLTQIIDDAVAFIQNKIPTLSMLSGTVARDVVVESPAQEFEKSNTELDRIQRQQLLTDATAYTDDELDGLAEAIGLTRSAGIQATGTVTFGLTNFTIASADILIPAGTEVATSPSTITSSSSTVVSFVTTADRTYTAANAASFFNPVTNLFEISAPIQTVVTGILGNVAAGTITVLISSVPGNPSVTNTIATSGGAEAETNASLLTRVRVKLTGTNVGTANGIIDLVEQDPNVFSSLLIRPGDIELVRDQFGNAADVLIIGEILTQLIETQSFTAGITEYILNRQPLASTGEDAVDNTIVGTVSGSSFNFVKGNHFRVEVDRDSITKNSTNGQSKIVFLGSPFPDASTNFTVTYSINSLVESLQTTLSSDDNRIIGTDIRVREADKVLVRVGASIGVFAGFTQADVAADAVNNVTTLLNTSVLDADIDRSDIIVTIQNTAGVDSVNTITLVLETKRPDETSFTIVSDINIGRTEFARPDPDPGGITIT